MKLTVTFESEEEIRIFSEYLKTQKEAGKLSTPPDASEDPLKKVSVNDLGLPNRILNSLLAENLYTVYDLTHANSRDLMRIPNLGRGSLVKIRDALNKRGYQNHI
jgi:DNA-directed RNA polymerase alpha subunit